MSARRLGVSRASARARAAHGQVVGRQKNLAVLAVVADGDDALRDDAVDVELGSEQRPEVVEVCARVNVRRAELELDHRDRAPFEHSARAAQHGQFVPLNVELQKVYARNALLLAEAVERSDADALAAAHFDLDDLRREPTINRGDERDLLALDRVRVKLDGLLLVGESEVECLDAPAVAASGDVARE